LKGKIEKNEQIINEMKRLVNVIKPLGHITVQCILSDNKVYILEINPRFGGGAPMSIKAGANSCENLYRLLQGEHLSYNENYMDNLVFSRFDDCISINSGNDIR
jgi:carbamoyl-phosphate synthase large subunit